MYEPQPLLVKTLNGIFIDVYDYLQDCQFLILSNELVIAMHKDSDTVSILTKDKRDIYFDIAEFICRKPTLGEVNINYSTSNLKVIETVNKNKQFIELLNFYGSSNNDLLNIDLTFFRRD